MNARADENRALLPLATVIALNILFFGTYNQTFNMLPIWASDRVDRELGFEVPVPWLIGLDGLFGILVALGVIRLWAAQARKGTEPREIDKLAIGFALLACAFAWLASGAAAAGDGKVGLPWCVPYFFLAALATAFIFSSTLALISRCAPASLVSIMMAAYAFSAFAGTLLVGWLGRFYEAMGPALFWSMHGGLAALGLALLLAARGLLSARLGTAREPAA